MALALLAPSLAGCLGGQGCGEPEPRWGAAYEDPGLYDRLAAAAANGTLQSRDHAPEGLPFDHPTGAPWRSLRVEIAQFHRGEEPPRRTLELDGGGTVRGWIAVERSPEEVRDAFLAFARNLSAAPPEVLDEAAQAFVEHRDVGAYDPSTARAVASLYVGALPGPLRLEGFVEGLDAPLVPQDVGRAAAEQEPWRVGFRSVWREGMGTAAGRTVVLAADPAGRATVDFAGPPDLGAVNAAAAFASAYNAFNLGPAPLVELAPQPMAVC
jgi:hypothetical protein